MLDLLVGVYLVIGIIYSHALIFVGVVANMTGGSIYFHPRFDPTHDGPILNSELQRLFTRMTGYNCLMRVRCGNGRPVFPSS
jgi:protein transport protein SEC24